MTRMQIPARLAALAGLLVALASCDRAAERKAPGADSPAPPQAGTRPDTGVRPDTGAWTPSAPPLAAVDGRRLAAGSWSYTSRVRRDGATQDFGQRTITVAPIEHNDADAWLVVESRSGGALTGADSVVLARGDLRPLHRGALMGTIRFVVDFSDAGLRGLLTSTGGSMPLVHNAKPTYLPNVTALEAMFSALPLRAGWRASSDVLAIGARGATLLPVELEVTGEAPVQLPVGTFDCWVMTMRSRGATQEYYVAKKGQHVVKVIERSSAFPSTVLERTLVAAPGGGPTAATEKATSPSS